MGALLPLITTTSASHIKVGKLLALPIPCKGIDSFAVTTSELRESSFFSHIQILNVSISSWHSAANTVRGNISMVIASALAGEAG